MAYGARSIDTDFTDYHHRAIIFSTTNDDMLYPAQRSFYVFAFALLGLFWLSMPQTAFAQEVRGAVYVDNPPEELEAGSLLDLFAAFREGKHQIHFEFEVDSRQASSHRRILPVRFQTAVRKDGEALGRSTRDPMPYFPGDMLMCPETWDFITMLYEVAGDDGQLPPGEYEVMLVAEIVEGEGEIEPGHIRFVVPER